MKKGTTANKPMKTKKHYSISPDLAKKVALEAVYTDSFDSQVIERALEMYFSVKPS